MNISSRKKATAIALLVVIALILYVRCFTPQAWRWSRSNLQVRIHRLAYEDRLSRGPYWNQLGFGWSKGGLFLLDWWRKSAGDDLHGGEQSTEARIVGVTPRGVSVKVTHHESRGGTFNFDKTLFIAADGTARIDLSNELYITGYFEVE